MLQRDEEVINVGYIPQEVQSSEISMDLNYQESLNLKRTFLKERMCEVAQSIACSMLH